MTGFKRAKIYTTSTARIRRWESRDGVWRVLEVKGLYGPRRCPYFVARAARAGEVEVSRHKTKDAAFRRVAAEMRRVVA